MVKPHVPQVLGLSWVWKGRRLSGPAWAADDVHGKWSCSPGLLLAVPWALHGFSSWAEGSALSEQPERCKRHRLGLRVLSEADAGCTAQFGRSQVCGQHEGWPMPTEANPLLRKAVP